LEKKEEINTMQGGALPAFGAAGGRVVDMGSTGQRDSGGIVQQIKAFQNSLEKRIGLGKFWP